MDSLVKKTDKFRKELEKVDESHLETSLLDFSIDLLYPPEEGRPNKSELRSLIELEPEEYEQSNDYTQKTLQKPQHEPISFTVENVEASPDKLTKFSTERNFSNCSNHSTDYSVSKSNNASFMTNF